MAFAREMRIILFSNVITNLLSLIYLYIGGAVVGVVLAAISGSNSCAQLALYKKEDRGVKQLRIGLGVVASIISVALLFEGMSDLLLCTAIVFVRIAESFSRITLMRLAMVYSSLMWAYYAYQQQLYWMSVAEVIVGCVWLAVLFVYAVFQRKKTQSA